MTETTTATTISGRAHVHVVNPADPFGSPAYDGPAARAHHYLERGTYKAVLEDGHAARITVYADTTSIEITTCRACGIPLDADGGGLHAPRCTRP